MSLRIGILGAGGWGTALGLLLHQNDHAATLWEFQSELAERLKKTRENPDFLPGVTLPSGIEVTSDLEAAVSDKDMIVLALPSHTVRQTAKALSLVPIKHALFVSGTKGIENHTLLRMSELILQTVPDLTPERVVVLSGPSHAEEVALSLPTVVVAASADPNASRKVQEAFMNPAFRVYTSDDVAGVEFGGAFKNVIAIAAGISDGVGFGDNTKAALVTRGIVEMTRLGGILGANPSTFAGLSGLGDLVVTCWSRHSRNRYVGEQIGKGRKLSEVLKGMKMVAEGVRTTQSVYDLSQKHGADTPISTEVYRMLFEGKVPKTAVFDLMTREKKTEV
ncbi:MAG TPA: NAD(P)H-dependent glycerol-3-phosphate dehydrogenase [bacterium]